MWEIGLNVITSQTRKVAGDILINYIFLAQQYNLFVLKLSVKSRDTQPLAESYSDQH